MDTTKMKTYRWYSNLQDITSYLRVVGICEDSNRDPLLYCRMSGDIVLATQAANSSIIQALVK